MKSRGLKIGAMPFDPNRIIYTIHYGRFRGHHFIYKTLEAFHHHEPDAVLYSPWYSVSLQGWVQTDCGHIMQCLAISVLINKKRQKTDLWRFPTQTDYIYVRKDGSFDARDKPEYKFLYRNSPHDKRHSRNGGTTRMKKVTSPPWSGSPAKLVSFVKYWAFHSMPPYLAYMRAYNCNSPRVARRHSEKLISSKISLVKDIIKMYKELFDKEGLTVNEIAKNISNIAKNSPKDADKLTALRLALVLRGELSSREPILQNPQFIINNNSVQKSSPAITEGVLKLRLPESTTDVDTVKEHQSKAEMLITEKKRKKLHEYINWKNERFNKAGLTNFKEQENSTELPKTQIRTSVFDRDGNLISPNPD